MFSKFLLYDGNTAPIDKFKFVISHRDTGESRDSFFESDLRATIGEAYAVKGDPDVSLFHLLFPLHEADGLPAPA